jgi:transcriptional regulator with XRE-family HTH domain
MDARADPHHTCDVTAEFGWFVKRLRRARGLTQEQLADRCGLSSDTIRRLEHGAFSPSLDTLTKLCEGLSLSLSTLFSAFELAERDDAREITDLLASRPPREYQLVYRVLRTLFNELDRQSPMDEPDDDPPSDDRQGDDPPNEGELVDDEADGDEPE